MTTVGELVGGVLPSTLSLTLNRLADNTWSTEVRCQESSSENASCLDTIESDAFLLFAGVRLEGPGHSRAVILRFALRDSKTFFVIIKLTERHFWVAWSVRV